jgi:hypothetical protein
MTQALISGAPERVLQNRGAIMAPFRFQIKEFSPLKTVMPAYLILRDLSPMPPSCFITYVINRIIGPSWEARFGIDH